MDKFFEYLANIIDATTNWFWGIVALIFLKDPIKRIFNKIKFYIYQGAKFDFDENFLKPFKKMLEGFDKRLDKAEEKLEKVEDTQERILQHLKNNNQHIENLLESIKKDEEKIAKKIDERIVSFKECKNYEKL